MGSVGIPTRWAEGLDKGRVDKAIEEQCKSQMLLPGHGDL